MVASSLRGRGVVERFHGGCVEQPLPGIGMPHDDSCHPDDDDDWPLPRDADDERL